MMVISSLVVHCTPDDFESVRKKIDATAKVEIVKTHASKMAVVLETETTEEAVVLSDSLRRMPGVIDMELVAPMIPQDHPVVIGEDVSQVQNGGEACLECHNDPDMADEVTQTKHPERNNCLQCHIPVAEESATAQDFQMDNTFQKYQPGK